MKRLAVLITGVMIALGAMAQKVNAPDFAFPKQVAAQSEAALKTALKRGNGPATVRALIDLTLAEVAIDRDSLPSVVSTIRQTRSLERDSVTAAMTDLFLARILNDVYTTEIWDCDQRVLPLEPLPANPYEWSGAQFRNQISLLTQRALSQSKLLKKVRIEQWKDVLTLDGNKAIYYPTLYDFAAQFTINVEESVQMIGQVLPLKALSEPIGTVRVANKDVMRILKVYDELIRFHADNPAPRINFTIKRLDFLSNHIFADDGNYHEAPHCFNQALMKIFNTEFPLTEFSGDALLTLLIHDMTQEQCAHLYYLTGIFKQKYRGYINMST